MPPSWLPEDGVRRALRAVARDPQAPLAEYASPYGLPALRQQLAWRLAQHGVEAPPEQIVLTDSGTHSLDLVCRFLLEPGDTVLIDDPCYFNFQALLRAHRARIVGVPYTPSGPDLAAFERALIEHRPRLYVTNSAIHNPTGATLAPAVAHRVLKLAGEHDLLIVEDDIFADFETKPAPRLAAFDGLARVVSIGSFSKTLSAAARCGYIAARPEWVESLIDLKLATSFGNGQLNAERRASVAGGRYLPASSGVDAREARRRDGRDDPAARLRGPRYLDPARAGMFVWARLPDALDAADIARHALEEGVVSRRAMCSARRNRRPVFCALTCHSAIARRSTRCCNGRWKSRPYRGSRRTPDSRARRAAALRFALSRFASPSRLLAQQKQALLIRAGGTRFLHGLRRRRVHRRALVGETRAQMLLDRRVVFPSAHEGGQFELHLLPLGMPVFLQIVEVRAQRIGKAVQIDDGIAQPVVVGDEKRLDGQRGVSL